MLTVVASTAAYLRIRASGRLGVDGYRRFEPAFVAELKRVQAPIALLLDMQGFGGWTVGGFLRDLAWDLKNRRTFSRIAVVGDKTWHRWITAAGAPVFRAPMKFFPASEQRRAEDWLARPS
jgi:hypothetical protein